MLFLLLALCSLILSGEDVGAIAARAPRLGLRQTTLTVHAPRAGWELGFTSSVAVDRKGDIYLLQRGLLADPVVVINKQGKFLRSWGRGLFQIPHSVRVDREGNIWTVDAASSKIFKFTPKGVKLMEIVVGEQPKRSSEFVGTADIAFGPGGRIFIADGYGNARVLEYTADGKRVRQWGQPGTGNGDFNLPHGIAVDENGVVYVADRENGRIQKFDMDGRFRGEIKDLGKTFSLTLQDGFLWIGTQRREEPNGSRGWLMKLNRETGAVLGVVESPGHHSIDVTAEGEILVGVRPDQLLWFRR